MTWMPRSEVMSGRPSARPVATQARTSGTFPRNAAGTNEVFAIICSCAFVRTTALVSSRTVSAVVTASLVIRLPPQFDRRPIGLLDFAAREFDCRGVVRVRGCELAEDGPVHLVGDLRRDSR